MLTRTGLMAGSPGYMSPEQISSGEITPASDVFSLGAVLAYAATARNPFGDGPTPALLYRLIHAEPDFDTVTDPALRALISECLAKDPGWRPTPRQILARIGNGGPAAGPVDPRSAHGLPPVADRAHISTAYGPATAVADTALQTTAVQTPARPGPTQLYPPGSPAPAVGEGRTRRALLLSGFATVAVAAGVTTGVVLTRSHTQRSAASSSTSPGSSPSSAPPAVVLPTPVGSWPLDERSGTSVSDAVGGHNGIASEVQWQAGPDGAAQFDGVGSQITTEGPVLTTGPSSSFTVSAWVYLPKIPNFFATAVSQEADPDSGFYLQYSSDDLRWALSRPGIRALSINAPATNTWTHLVGVCDAVGDTLRLYVNGVQEGTTADTKSVDSTGPLVIGRAKSAGRPTDFFPGSIKNVQVFDQALSTAQIKTLE